MFLDNYSRVIKTTPTEEFVAYISDAKECKQIENGTLKTTECVLAAGEAKDATEEFCKRMLDEPTNINNLLTKSVAKSYKCFCCEDLGLENLVAHPTARSSWDCMLDSLCNASHLIIISRKLKNV